jgi:hypothetical protein
MSISMIYLYKIIKVKYSISTFGRTVTILGLFCLARSGADNLIRSDPDPDQHGRDLPTQPYSSTLTPSLPPPLPGRIRYLMRHSNELTYLKKRCRILRVQIFSIPWVILKNRLPCLLAGLAVKIHRAICVGK